MRGKFVALVFLFVAACGTAFGFPITTFSQIIAFGDSLSDPGNASFLTGGAEPKGSNYATRTVGGNTLKYWTDGPNTSPGTGSGPTGLWIDQLAAKMGLTDPAPALVPGVGGTNYAVGSAQTGSSGPADMQNQVGLFLTQHPGNASANALYTFWGGANDIFAGNNPVKAADNIFGEIKEVAADGGKYFLWLNLPSLGDTPAARVQGAGAVAQGNAASAAFNAEWSKDVGLLDSQGLDVIGVDVSSLFNQILADPAAFGFTDMTDACENFAPFSTCTSASNPNQYLFWDDVHPTTAADADLANLAYKDLLAVPEPATCGLMILAACCLIAFYRKQRSA